MEFHEDDTPGWSGKIDYAALSRKVGRSPGPEDDYEPLDLVSPNDWDDDDVPEREWYWQGLFPHAQVSILSAEGGTGKSLLGIQIGVASALREDFLGLKLRPGRIIYMGAEDAEDEFKRRLDDVARSHRCNRSDIVDFKLLPRAGEEALLSAPDRKGVMQPTELWHRLLRTIKQVRPVAVFLDTCADVYGGDEIKRSQVRQFIGQLRAAAIRYQTAIVLLYHPSMSGVESGKGMSGSTAWANSARAAVYMTREGGKDDPDSDTRKLTTTKTNYGKFGDGLRVRWEKGVFVLDDPNRPLSADSKARYAKAEKLFIERLGEHNGKIDRVRLTNSKQGNYAPRFLHEKAKSEFSVRDFEGAMNRLLSEGRIKIEAYRANGRDVKHLEVNRDFERRYGDDE